MGQEEGRMGEQNGDEAWKKREYSSKTTPARAALTQLEVASFRAELRRGNDAIKINPLQRFITRWQL